MAVGPETWHNGADTRNIYSATATTFTQQNSYICMVRNADITTPGTQAATSNKCYQQSIISRYHTRCQARLKRIIHIMFSDIVSSYRGKSSSTRSSFELRTLKRVWRMWSMLALAWFTRGINIYIDSRDSPWLVPCRHCSRNSQHQRVLDPSMLLLAWSTLLELLENMNWQNP